jgi:hypothetical protein
MKEGQDSQDITVVFRPATEKDLDSVWMMWKDIMDERVYYPYDSESYSRHDIELEWINLTKNTIFVAAKHDCNIVAAYILKANQPGYGKHIANAAYTVVIITVARDWAISFVVISSRLPNKKDIEGYSLILLSAPIPQQFEFGNRMAFKS